MQAETRIESSMKTEMERLEPFLFFRFLFISTRGDRTNLLYFHFKQGFLIILFIFGVIKFKYLKKVGAIQSNIKWLEVDESADGRMLC